MMPPNNHACDFTSHPFVETVSRNDATALVEGFAKCWPLFERFGLGVDALAGAAVVLRPTTDQAPARPPRSATFEF